MNLVWLLCGMVALAIGVLHAWYVYRQEVEDAQLRVADPSIAVRVRAAYYASWTLLLWALLGSTLVIYWVVASVLYLLAKAFGISITTSNTRTDP